MTIYNLDILLSQLWISPLFYVRFCYFLTCIQVSQEAGKLVWYSHLLNNFPQFVVIHIVKGFSIVSEAEVDAFLELLHFFDDPKDVGNLISGPSAFSKSSFCTWTFSVHVLLKPSLEDFEHYLASMGNEHNCGVSLNILWHCPYMRLEWKLTYSSAEFSKFAGMMSAALSQHHLLGLEIAQLEFHHFN